uniref:Uncharacterized protein n=1 Tax=Ditylenchus dipsaci TaxID=166011 RepID=A0A915EHY7_9BILA
MFCKIKAIATICLEKGEPKEFEPPKSIKLRVASSTKVRKFVAKALKKAALESPLVECVDVQYSSKKFGGKFLSVDFEQQVKDGREYKIWIREVVPLIKDEGIKRAQKFAVIAGEVDLITCKSYEDVDANSSIGFDDVFAENLEGLNERPITYVEVVALGEGKDCVETPKEVDLVQVEPVSVLVDQVIVSMKSEKDSPEDDKVSTSVKPPGKETEVVSGKPPSTPSSFKKFWPWSSSPAADGSPKN